MYYYLRPNRQLVRLRIAVNDFEVQGVDDGSRPFILLNPWLAPASNEIEVTWKLEDDPAAEDTASVEVALYETASPQLPSAEQDVPLHVFAWGIRDPSAGSLRHHRFVPELRAAPKTEFWARAEPLELDEATRASAASFLHEYYDAYRRKDARAVWAAGAFRGRELGKSVVPPELESTWNGGFRQLRGQMASADWAWDLPAFDPTRLELDLVGKGRALRARIDGDAFVVVRSKEGRSAYYEAYVSKIDGEWTVVR